MLYVDVLMKPFNNTVNVSNCKLITLCSVRTHLNPPITDVHGLLIPPFFSKPFRFLANVSDTLISCTSGLVISANVGAQL